MILSQPIQVAFCIFGTRVCLASNNFPHFKEHSLERSILSIAQLFMEFTITTTSDILELFQESDLELDEGEIVKNIMEICVPKSIYAKMCIEHAWGDCALTFWQNKMNEFNIEETIKHCVSTRLSATH
jgi:hypothetical protein